MSGRAPSRTRYLGYGMRVRTPGLGRIGLSHFLQAAEKAKELPCKAVIENDQAWLSSLLHYVPDLINGVGEAYQAITVEAFEQLVSSARSSCDKCGIMMYGTNWPSQTGVGVDRRGA
jgi:hypothetical protein